MSDHPHLKRAMSVRPPKPPQAPPPAAALVPAPPPTPVMSVADAGRRGGKATKARHGTAYYEAIGRKGGIATQRKNAEAAAALEALKREERV